MIFSAIILYSISATPRDLPAVVSVEWLSQNLDRSNLVVIDIRSDELFKKSHIPGSVHAPFPRWIRQDEQRMLELPGRDSLRLLLGSLGITDESHVVIVNRTDSDWNRADATRVAWTCLVSGVKTVSVLDGGYNHWLKLKKPVTDVIVSPVGVNYRGMFNTDTLILKNDVLERIGKSVLIDARLPEDYFGITSDKGHIKSAMNLPGPWAYKAEGTFRDTEELRQMVSGLIGEDRHQEIIVYCQVGGFASTWWFILSKILGYQNVKLYDGSFEEWSKDPDLPVSKFRWE